MKQTYQRDRMHIQQATEEDIESIVRIEDCLFDNAFGIGTIRRELQASHIVVMKDGRDVVGFAMLRLGELPDLLRLGVLPGFQGRGLGSWLLAHLFETFKGPMMLTVRKNNPRARSLYEENGFRVIATTDISWLMKRVTSS